VKRLVPCIALVAACVPSQSELRAPVDDAIAHDFGSAHVDVAALLAKPLDEAGAVRIALATNARLAATLDELGIAGGELAAALGLGPLELDGMFRFGAGGSHEFEIDAIQPVLALVTAPRKRAAARADLEAARARASELAIALASRVEIAMHDLLAAQQDVELRQTAFEAADAAATLRERMFTAGNTTELALDRDRDAREQARIDLARARAAVEARREALIALLGVSGDRTNFTIAGTLGGVPDAPPPLDDLEAAAVAASFELRAGRARDDAAENRAGAERVASVLPELGVGASAIELDGKFEIGPAIRLGLPIFDNRAGERAIANAKSDRAGHELAADAVELRAHARAIRVLALEAYGEAKRLHDVVLPLRQQIVDQTLLHYNAMDADPFQLIIARRELADAGHQYLDALRRYADAMSEVAALRRGANVRPDVDLP
jgi:outer membrane protein TolC